MIKKLNKEGTKGKFFNQRRNYEAVADILLSKTIMSQI